MFPPLAVPEVPGLVILPPPTALGELDAFVLLRGPVGVVGEPDWGPAACPVVLPVEFCASAFCPSWKDTAETDATSRIAIVTCNIAIVLYCLNIGINRMP
jgi:hypothetical protein